MNALEAVQPLHSSPWFEVARHPDGTVEVVRTAKTFASLEELDRAHVELVRALDRLPRERIALLVDLRRAPARNDPEFEHAMPAHRARLFERFARRAVVVETAVGKLQVQRHARQDGHAIAVFTDYAEARAFCRGSS